MQKIILGGLVCFLVMVLVIGVVVTFYAPPAAPAEAARQSGDDCQTNSFGYLLALKEGNSIAAAYWKPGVRPSTLYSVTKFDGIKHGSALQRNGQPYKNPRIYYQYEVESSTHGGLPIRKRWDVVMERNRVLPPFR
jgi:hypothetical protein